MAISPIDPAFRHFADDIARLPQRPLADEDVRMERFLLHRQGALEMFYAPFDYVNADARVALVGITPGATQMREAFAVARDELRAGSSHDDALRAAKAAASFAGTMRRNLVSMLDGLGLARQLGIASSGQLFDSHAHLAHTTSAVRNPVFVRGDNYTGSKPKLVSTPLLRRYVDEALGGELELAANAVVIPLGVNACAAVESLVTAKRFERARVLSGFPHPSGGNGHRVSQFAAARDELAESLRSWFARPIA